MTYYIIPGFGEGRWHARKLARPLHEMGYKPVRSAADAQLVIAHSGACYFLPNSAANQCVILINPPYWPSRPVLLSFVHKIVRDLIISARRRHLLHFAHKTCWNITYIGLNLLRTVRIARLARRHNLDHALHTKRVAIIRNRRDPLLCPEFRQLAPVGGSVRCYDAPGEHDDCWLYADDYAKMIDRIVSTSH